MSFDLLVFEPTAVEDAGFAAWFQEQTNWSKDHDYNDPKVAGPALRAFFMELIDTFPPMNGPLTPPEEAIDVIDGLESRLTDYSIGRKFIYAGFAWSRAGMARETVLALAAKHQVAVALVSEPPPTPIIRPAKLTWRQRLTGKR